MITVLTPTYNRAYTLYRAYESLKKQNNLNFEWVIIDDGSSDNTEELISGWLGEKNFIFHIIKDQMVGNIEQLILALRRLRESMF